MNYYNSLLKERVANRRKNNLENSKRFDANIDSIKTHNYLMKMNLLCYFYSFKILIFKKQNLLINSSVNNSNINMNLK